MRKIILSSSSPRRSEILKSLNYNFEIIPSDYVEAYGKAEFSYEYVEAIAYNKALATAKKLHGEYVVIGADTVVVYKNKIIGKPHDMDDACKTLKMLSGKTHSVVTSIALVCSDSLKSIVRSETSYVTFENLSPEKIFSYVYDYKPLDKAGSYGIQELPDDFITKVEGEIDNVVGLPSKLLSKMLIEI